MDELPRLGKRELICLLLFTCYYVVSVWRGFLFLWVLGMGYVILLWHSLSLPYNYFVYKPDRTNGTANAHLIFGPTNLSTKTSFAKFDIIVKKIKVNPGSSFKKIFVGLEYILLHAKFHDHRTISSVGDDF